MHEARNYDALRRAERSAETERQFGEAGAQITPRSVTENAPAQTPPQEQQQEEKPFLTEVELYEATREARIKELDAKVQAGKINQHEMQYQLNRFENTPTPQPEIVQTELAQREAATTKESQARDEVPAGVEISDAKAERLSKVDNMLREANERGNTLESGNTHDRGGRDDR